MRQFVVLLAFLVWAAPASATEERRVGLQDFSAIDVRGAYELRVEVGDDYSISLSGAPEDLERAEATVSNGVLTLGSKGRRAKHHDGDHDGLGAVITLPALDSLSVSGVAEADISGVDAGAFKVHLSGVGDVTIAGRCGTLDARVSGVGELNAKALECRVADVALSGMGEASVYAREAAKAEVSGMGEINIYGSPAKVEKRGGFLSEITVH